MAAWSTSAPDLPSGSSWGNTETAVLTLNYIKIELTMKTARGTGSTYYVRIAAKFSNGSGGTFQPQNPYYFFVGNSYKGYAPPSTPGTTITRYYTGSGGTTNANLTVEAGVSTKNGDYQGSGVAAHETVTVPPVMTYTVSYNGNGSTGGSTSSQTKVSGTALTLRQNGYTRTGYNFVRWNTKADGSGTNYSAGGTYTANAAVTLYAQWAKASIPVYANVGGTIHQVEKAYINVGGTIKEATAYTNVNGTIKTLV